MYVRENLLKYFNVEVVSQTCMRKLTIVLQCRNSESMYVWENLLKYFNVEVVSQCMYEKTYYCTSMLN